MTGVEALARLKEGNARVVAGYRSVAGLLGHMQLNLEQQQPFAIVLGCSDSRAPAEHVFDVGLGELFVIRIAGNIVAPSGVGSVEFAVERFHTNLVVVMGHSNCGAIAASIESIIQGADHTSPNVMSIVSRVRPSIEHLVPQRADFPVRGTQPFIDLHRSAIRANVQASVDQLRHGSAMIEQLAASGEMLIVGATLDLQSGKVDFFD
jgi:carbonic anhydrase